MADAAIEKSLDPKAQLVRQYIALVRAKTRDYPELNRLIEGVETSDRQIAFAIMETIEDFNTTPPLIPAYSITNFPSVDLLVNGALIAIFESVGILQTRNQLTYSDGQMQLGVNDKAPMLLNWINIFRNKYEAKKGKLKRALNLQTALGNPTGVSSEYLSLGGLFNDAGELS